LRKSSSDNRRLAFRAVAFVYAATTILFSVIFVRYVVRHPHVIRSAVLGYAILAAATAYGLWRERDWGRGLGLIMALGTSALGVIETASIIVSHHGPLAGSIVLLVVSTGLTYVLSRRIFNPLPDE
jgi:uncharacterized membrane protein (DUF2068 family)